MSRTKDQIIGEINARMNILQQKDYIARKVAIETADALKKALPEVEIPSLAKYAEVEQQATVIRGEIRELEAELENAED